MNKVLFCLLICGITTVAVAQKNESLNTGKDVAYMSQYEKNVLYDINLLRSDPANYLNSYAYEISSLRDKVKRGEKDKTYIVSTHVNGKNDSIWYDRNERRLSKFVKLQAALSKAKPLPPFVPDEGFSKASDMRDIAYADSKRVDGYIINKTEFEYYTTVKSTGDYYYSMLPGQLHSESSDELDTAALKIILSDDKDLLLAVHEREEKEPQPPFDKYPIHFYVTFGTKIKKPNLVYQKPIEGYQNQSLQFAEGTDDGFVVAAINNIIKVSAEGNILWRNAPAVKGDYEIKSYVRLKDGNFVFGGWNKIKGKSSLWLFKVDASGKTVWEKNIPVKDGNIVALTEDRNGKGVWAVVSDVKSKKVVEQTLRLFDSGGNEKAKYLLRDNMQEDNSTTSFSNDVRLFQTRDSAFSIFGTTRYSSLIFSSFDSFQNGSAIPIDQRYIQESVIDPAFSNCITVRNPAKGYYVCYENKTEDRNEDYRLISQPEFGDSAWEKDLGGDLMDGPSSLVIDSKGNLILAGYSYSGVSGEKSEPAFEKDHCDVWIIKVDDQGNKLWDKTLTGPGCILNARLFLMGDKIGVVFKEEQNSIIALIEEK